MDLRQTVEDKCLQIYRLVASLITNLGQRNVLKKEIKSQYRAIDLCQGYKRSARLLVSLQQPREDLKIIQCSQCQRNTGMCFANRMRRGGDQTGQQDEQRDCMQIMKGEYCRFCHHHANVHYETNHIFRDDEVNVTYDPQEFRNQYLRCTPGPSGEQIRQIPNSQLLLTQLIQE